MFRVATRLTFSSVERSHLSRADKRLWKRVWRTLVTRDRSVAAALGRPAQINLEDTDVEMVIEEDFIEDEPDHPADYPADPAHVQFFLQYQRLCGIMGLILSQRYSVASQAQRRDPIELIHNDNALAHWLQKCPAEVYGEKDAHHFWSALHNLNCQ